MLMVPRYIFIRYVSMEARCGVLLKTLYFVLWVNSVTFEGHNKPSMLIGKENVKIKKSCNNLKSRRRLYDKFNLNQCVV